MTTLEQRLARWEAQRTLKNLMGIYANLLVQNRNGEIFSTLWAEKDDASLMLNDGAYVGPEAIRGYYAAWVERNQLVAKLLQQRLPEELGEKTEEEIYGIGPFRALPMSCPVIELAEDGQTAKGLWFCQGTYSRVDERGPASHWTWGYYAVDFICENGDWKIWHLQYLNDVDHLCGQSWAEPEKPYPPLAEFAALAEFKFPAYTVARCFRPLYDSQRPLTLTPEIPKPYGTFAETFSYGVGKEDAQ